MAKQTLAYEQWLHMPGIQEMITAEIDTKIDLMQHFASKQVNLRLKGNVFLVFVQDDERELDPLVRLMDGDVSIDVFVRVNGVWHSAETPHVWAEDWRELLPPELQSNLNELKIDKALSMYLQQLAHTAPSSSEKH